jgi:hypothetical protein
MSCRRKFAFGLTTGRFDRTRVYADATDMPRDLMRYEMAIVALREIPCWQCTKTA